MVAQALAEDCHMVTIDKVFPDYGVPVLWSSAFRRILRGEPFERFVLGAVGQPFLAPR
jgi:hypothetical protein